LESTIVKHRSLADAVTWRLKQSGSVVFTNGVFDLIHPGHVELLEAARNEGDRLVVGINSDQSVRGLGKGSDRPIVAQDTRARIVAALEAVDCVVIFDELTPLELVKALSPDVIVKGGDYSADAVVGASEVIAAGGRLVIVPLVENQSTTRIVERLRASS
jgi:rfaE bifunctional protein nucleotidyltransferase chain/domain